MPQGNQNVIRIEPIFMERNELNPNNELENQNLLDNLDME